jgi:hypothetical protein
MELKDILNRLDKTTQANEGGVKTAGAQPTTPIAPDALRDAVRNASGDGETKVASAPEEDTSAQLLKMASDLASAEDQALTKRASVLGAAMCDGFMTRFASYEEAAGAVAPQAEKVAAAQEYHGDITVDMIKQAAASPDFTKFAEDNPQLVKEAFDLGYQQTLGAMEKQAAAEYEQGYNETMATVHKIAAECYIQGETKIAQILAAG